MDGFRIKYEQNTQLDFFKKPNIISLINDIHSKILINILRPSNISGQKEVIGFVNHMLRKLIAEYKYNSNNPQTTEFLTNLKLFILVVDKTVNNFNFEVQILCDSQLHVLGYFK